MRMTLANKISVCIVGVVALAVFSSLAALVSCWRLADLMRRTLDENLPSVRAAEELEIAVLEQRGLVAAYLLDEGDPRWLSKLEEFKPNFDFWWSEAHKTTNTPVERQVLDELEQVFRDYAAQRDRVVQLHRNGQAAEARSHLVNEVSQLYDKAYELCERYLEANVQFVDTAAADARRQIHRVTLTVFACVLLSLALGVLLLWLFFSGIVLPVRALVADARGFSASHDPHGSSLPTDELRAVGIYLRGLMSDVADQRTTLERSRQRLRDAEKLASVGKLAASVAHEIRNPLTAIRMWLFSLQKEVGGQEAIDRRFDVIAAEVTRLEKIVQNFLEFARPPKLELTRQPLAAILDRAADLAAPRMNEKGIRFARRDGPDLPQVLADREQLTQVLLNLLTNAAEAADQGGCVSLAATAERDGEGRPAVVIRVSDNGPGIPREHRARIFEPFFSTKEAGMGLGLCIAAKIVACHEGRLQLESTAEKGTTIALTLPVERNIH